MEIGTLKELGVKPGDVVELVHNGIIKGSSVGKTGTVYVENGRFCTKGEMSRGDDHGHKFRIISRASDKPRTWGEMTPEEKGALLLAEYQGKVVEVYIVDHDWKGWCKKVMDFTENLAYRIRPEPKRETVTLPWWEVATDKLKGHRITFDLIDGKPDCASIKMEEL